MDKNRSIVSKTIDNLKLYVSHKQEIPLHGERDDFSYIGFCFLDLLSLLSNSVPSLSDHTAGEIIAR